MLMAKSGVKSDDLSQDHFPRTWVMATPLALHSEMT